MVDSRAEKDDNNKALYLKTKFGLKVATLHAIISEKSRSPYRDTLANIVRARKPTRKGMAVNIVGIDKFRITAKCRGETSRLAEKSIRVLS